MKVLAVVLNYRTPDLAVQCLESLQREVEKVGSMHVVVTDNDSGDGSVEIIGNTIKANQWGWCTLIPLQENGGYCFGNNAGIRPYLYSDDPPEYVLLVNPDAYVHDNAVRALLGFMDSHPHVGIAGARVEDPTGQQSHSAFRFPSPTTELIEGFNLGMLDRLAKKRVPRYELLDEGPVQVDWVTGAAMMIRKEVFDDIGLLDEGYFLYFDEVDFCLRARRAGWLAYYVPESAVVHLEGVATGLENQRKGQPRFPDYWFTSRRRFFIKNHGRLYAMLADAAFLGGYTTYRVRRIIQRQGDKDPPHFWWDFLRNSTFAKGFEI
jgi:GT2 family glycosyltransferase